jgi:hypothetical protein
MVAGYLPRTGGQPYAAQDGTDDRLPLLGSQHGITVYCCHFHFYAAQHRVHWTLGIRRHFQAFFWLRVFLLPSRVHARPPAGNAHRWAAEEQCVSLFFREVRQIGSREYCSISGDARSAGKRVRIKKVVRIHASGFLPARMIKASTAPSGLG